MDAVTRATKGGTEMKLIDAKAFEKVIRNEIPLREWMNKSIPEAMAAMGRLIEKLDEQQAMTWDTWHYTSQGELPEKDGEYLITVKLNDNRFINAFAIYTAGKGWLGIFKAPFAWQCIKSPENEK